jgi:large subunit ribosomal protein L10
MSSIAAKDTSAEPAKDLFTGPTGIAFGFDDPVAAAKKILEYAEKNDKFKVKGGVFEGRLCSVDDIKAISKLPPKDVILSMLAGTLQAPMAKLAGALNATLSQFAYALEALKTKRANV